MTLVSPPPFRTKERPRRSALKTTLWILGTAVVVAAIYLIFRGSAEKRQNEARQGRGGGAVLIATATAKKGDIGDYIKRIGNVVAVHTAPIFAQVTGVVKTVNYKEWQDVNEGDPLVDIDDRLYTATLLQAQGTLYKDEHVLAQAEKDLDRYQEAWKQRAVSEQILDDQVQLVEQEKGQVQIDNGIVDYDTAQVAYCHIKAPFSGRVGLRLVDPGNLVTAGATGGTPLVVVAQMQPTITVVFSVPESNGNLAQLQDRLKELKPGETITADIYDNTDTTKLKSGKFIALDNQIDTTTGSVRVRVECENDDLALFPNQFVNVHLLVRTLTNAILIPTAAIQQNGTTSYVYVIKDNVAHKQDVTLRDPPVVDDQLGITQVEGLNEGDVIADSSFDKLQDGSTVTVQGPAGQGKGKSRGKGGGSPAPGSSPSAPVGSGSSAAPAGSEGSPSPSSSASPRDRHNGNGSGNSSGNSDSGS